VAGEEGSTRIDTDYTDLKTMIAVGMFRRGFGLLSFVSLIALFWIGVIGVDPC
jgi:hypothetical protein